MPLTVKDAAAISRIAAVLAPHVTNGAIDGLGKHLGFGRLNGSNKESKIHDLLSELVSDGRSRGTAAQAIVSLVAEGHRRTVAHKAAMSVADADRVVEEMRVLGLPPGELARAGWRAGLTPAPTASQPTPRAEGAMAPRRPDVHRDRDDGTPRRHDEGLRYIQHLATDNDAPQQRGRELEKILADVLRLENLEPTRGITNVGEEIDLAFVLDGQHYLVECRWHRLPQGLPALREFSDKVRRKAEGTFGILLSMSGFVTTMNAGATTGSRLNCVGLTARELMLVLEGITTFARLVRRARAEASTRAVFYSGE